jgi:hypothetical protein
LPANNQYPFSLLIAFKLHNTEKYCGANSGVIEVKDVSVANRSILSKRVVSLPNAKDAKTKNANIIRKNKFFIVSPFYGVNNIALSKNEVGSIKSPLR